MAQAFRPQHEHFPDATYMALALSPCKPFIVAPDPGHYLAFVNTMWLWVETFADWYHCFARWRIWEIVAADFSVCDCVAKRPLDELAQVYNGDHTTAVARK